MSGEGAAPWGDALAAAQLIASEPGLGGVWLRAGAGEVRAAWLESLGAALPPGTPLRRVPPGADEARLFGGTDLAASLVARARVNRPGLLAEADGGIVIVPMAERLQPGVAARLAAVLDEGEAEGAPARIRLIALDEGEGDERLPAVLAERLGLWLTLPDRVPAGAPGPPGAPGGSEAAPQPLETLTALAAAFGVSSPRAPLFALRAARTLARMEPISEAHLATAARLTLAPRATRVPAPEQVPEHAQAPPPEPTDGGESEGAPGPLSDMLLQAVAAALPPEVLAGADLRAARSRARSTGAGSAAKGTTRGRPAGTRPGDPRRGPRIDVAATLAAAAPWQKLRGAEPGRLRLRMSDLRVRRLIEKQGETAILVVDASGSAALARLAEAKGAAELLLARAYVRRTEVSVIAFRGDKAETLLPPTRSLTRAKRALAELPGGGGTPLASALDAARAAALAARKRGRTPRIVMLTDGRANITRNGEAGRAAAEAEAESAARLLGGDGLDAIVIDTAMRPRGEAARLAASMGARYATLPHLSAAGIAAVAGG